MAEENRFIGMRNDYMCKAVLQKAPEVLKHLVAALMEMDVKDILSCELLNPIELGKDIGSKDCVLDVKLCMNSDRIINLEIQMYKMDYWPERSLLYWSRAFDELKEGEDYSKLKPTYQIGILNHTLFEDNPEFYAEYVLMSKRTGKVYTDRMSIRVLDISRIDKAGAEDKELVRWAKIFRAETMRELEQLAGKEEVLQSMVMKIKELSYDEKIRQQCEAREKYEKTILTQYRAGERKGRAQGMELGMARGLEQGRAEGKADIAQKMKQDGLDIEFIARYTGISEEQIREL